MMGKLAELVAAQDVGTWLIVALLVGYFVYKEWPDLKNRISSGSLRDKALDDKDATLGKKVDGIEKSLVEINEKLDRDYRRLNEFERWQRKTQGYTAESFRERELIIRGLVACLDGLHQLGANGKTEAVRDEIDTFLNKSAHSIEEA